MFVRSILVCAAVLGLSLMSAASAMGDDVIIPSWRGDAGTTYQEWLFGTSADPAAPDVVTNGYGSPTADISIGWAGSGWWDQFPPTAAGRLGVWDLGRGVDAENPELFGGITISVPNSSFSGLGTYTDVWVQVTYYVDINLAPTVNVTGATELPGGMVQLLETVPGWGSWFLSQSMWRIEPNTLNSTIVITGHDMGSLIDHVVVDTMSVPEPASMLLLGLGAAALGIRRKRSGR